MRSILARILRHSFICVRESNNNKRIQVKS